MIRETRDESHRESQPNPGGEPIAGVVLLWSDGPRSACAPLDRGPVRIGRDDPLGATLTDTKDRDDYLKKQAQAQFAVPEDQLIDGVRRVLARHQVSWT